MFPAPGVTFSSPEAGGLTFGGLASLLDTFYYSLTHKLWLSKMYKLRHKLQTNMHGGSAFPDGVTFV